MPLLPDELINPYYQGKCELLWSVWDGVGLHSLYPSPLPLVYGCMACPMSPKLQTTGIHREAGQHRVYYENEHATLCMQGYNPAVNSHM